jgi:hypothetical protein
LVLVLPASGWLTDRAFEAVFPEQLARRRPATLSRWAVRLIAAGVAVEVAALAGIWDRPERWIGVDWSFWASAGAAAAVIVAPAALGVLAGVLQALDGWAHRRLGRLD